jgi:hypothetical protein
MVSSKQNPEAVVKEICRQTRRSFSTEEKILVVEDSQLGVKRTLHELNINRNRASSRRQSQRDLGEKKTDQRTNPEVDEATLPKTD